jgi:glutathione S-transferase
MLTLYYAPGACSLASHIALEESGGTYTSLPIDIASGEQYGEAYLMINPRGKVPALRLGDGGILTENLAIQLFVARSFPDAGLLPAGNAARAACESVMTWFSNTVHPAYRQIRRPGRFAEDEAAHPAIVAYGRKLFDSYLGEIDVMLEGKQWLMGDDFTLCDGYALVFYGWGRAAQIPVADLKNYTAWKDRMIARPAVRTILEREKSPLLSVSA